jgi:hypothetical protein
VVVLVEPHALQPGAAETVLLSLTKHCEDGSVIGVVAGRSVLVASCVLIVLVNLPKRMESVLSRQNED